MTTDRKRLLEGGAVAALALAALCGLGGDCAPVLATEGDDVEYTFGRPVKDGEQTYDAPGEPRQGRSQALRCGRGKSRRRHG